MTLNRKPAFFVILVLLVQSVIAQNEDFDYQEDFDYNDPDFYSDSDPSLWDYSRVQWDKVDFDRAGIYNSPMFYFNIPNDRYDDLDYTLVDYYRIRDHDKIDSGKYLNDMGCYSCSLDRGGQNIVFSVDRIEHQDSGDFVSIPGTFPSGSLFIAKEDRIEVILPRDVSFFNIPSDSRSTLNTRDREITLSDGTRVKGNIDFRWEMVFVNKGDRAVINNVQVTGSYTSIRIYLSDEESPGGGPFVMFGEDNIIIQGRRGRDFDVSFLEGNDYVDVNTEENDRLKIRPLNYGKITIIRHELAAPEVVVSGDYEGEWAKITNGKFDAVFGSEGVVRIDANHALQSEFGSVPMEIKVLDMDGNSLIIGGNGEAEKIIINNNNELSYVEIDAKVAADGWATCSFSVAIADAVSVAPSFVGDSETRAKCLEHGVFYMGDRRENYLQKNFGPGSHYNIYFDGIEGWDNAEVIILADRMDELASFNPLLVESIYLIELVDEKYMTEGGTRTDRAAYSMGNTLVFNREDVYSLSIGVIVHEAAHSYDYVMDMTRTESFYDSWYKTTNEGDVEKGEEMYYGHYAGYATEADAEQDGEVNRLTLADGGWQRVYGKTTIKEDIATTVEEIVNTGPDEEFDTSNPKVAGKVELLCEYGFLRGSHELCAN